MTIDEFARTNNELLICMYFFDLYVIVLILLLCMYSAEIIGKDYKSQCMRHFFAIDVVRML